MRATRLVIGGLAGLLITTSAGCKRAKPANPLKVTLYVMSKCPFGIEAENAFKDVVAKFGSDLNLKLEFIGDVTPDGGSSTGSFRGLASLHGPGEVMGDIYEACAMSYSTKWFDTVLCQNETINTGGVGANTFDACAKEAGVPDDAISKINACAEGKEGTDLVTASFKRADLRQVTSSPTIFVGPSDRPYEGPRTTPDLVKAVCQAFPSPKPALCDDILAP
jgi:hypothetical protein